MFDLSAKAMFGVILTIISLILAAFASYMNVKGSKGRLERRFVFGACALTWLIVSACMALVIVLPQPYHYIPLGLLIIIFPIVIYRLSLRHQLIREVERRNGAAAEGGDSSAE